MSAPAPGKRALREMRELNIDDLLKGLGWSGLARRMPALRRLFDGPATKLARIVLDFDRLIGEVGLAAAARATLPRLSVRLGISGTALAGPCLYLANHPGLGDALAMMAALDRPDLRIIALGSPYLRHLPRLAGHMLFLPLDGGGGTAVLRQAVQHLRRGGAVLTFPAGRIEADPAWDPEAFRSLAGWAGSSALLARLLPGLAIQPWAVAGVTHPRLRGHPFLKLRRKPGDRPWLAAVLQLALQMALPGRWTVRLELKGHAGKLDGVSPSAAMATLLESVHRGL